MGFDASSYRFYEDEVEFEVCVVVEQPITVEFTFQLMFSAANETTGLCDIHMHVIIQSWIVALIHCISEAWIIILCCILPLIMLLLTCTKNV